MNGRIYDPVIGRFVSPDPQIQNPYDLQSYNRYSYASNNPLIYTDPTGYSLWTKIRNTVIRVAAAVADAYGCSGYCSTSVGAYQGYQQGGWTGAITGGIGGYYSVQYPLTDGGNINWGNVGTLASINAGTGCINAAAGGGSCGRGALSGAVGTVGAAYGYMGAAIAGCAAGRIGGGSCREGAIEGIGTYAVSRAASGGFSYIMDALRPPPPQSASGSSGNTGNTEGVKNTSEVPTNEQQGRFILAANDLPVKETTEFGAAIVPNAKKIEASDDTLEAIMAQDPMNGKRPHAEVKGSVGELNRARIEPVVDQTRKGAPVAKKWWEWGLP